MKYSDSFPHAFTLTKVVKLLQRTFWLGTLLEGGVWGLLGAFGGPAWASPLGKAARCRGKTQGWCLGSRSSLSGSVTGTSRWGRGLPFQQGEDLATRC